MRNSGILAMVIALYSLCLTGCWDRIEIEERGFVVGVAIDMAKGSNAEETEDKEAEDRAKGKHRYVVSYQFVIPKGLQQDGGGKSFYNVSAEGDSLMDITRGLATRSSRTPYFEHIKIIIVSEEVAKNVGIADVLDFFLRDHEMRRGTKVMIAKGDARKVLEVKPPIENIPVMYIRSVTENNYRTARMHPPARIGDIHEKLLLSYSYAIPRIIGEKEEVKIAGTAVIQGIDNKMVGWLGEEETQGLNFLTGEAEGGVQKVKVKDNLIVYEYRGKKRTIEADVKDKEHIHLKVKISSEGFIPETLVPVDWLEESTVSEIEKKVEEDTVRIAQATLDKLHKEFKVDVIGAGEYLSKTHPELWNEIKDDWDRGKNYFSKSKIEVESKVVIRNSGVINKSERKLK